MSKFRRIAAAFLLVATLAAPSGVFASSSESSTSESLSVASTVSMTAPATATFVYSPSGDIAPGGGQADFTYEATVTVIGSNNPTGVTLTAKVDPWTQAGITIPTTKRFGYFASNAVPGATTGGLVNGTPPGFAWANSSAVVTLASSTGPLANASTGIGFAVNASEFPVGGSYVSAVHYTTSTN